MSPNPITDETNQSAAAVAVDSEGNEATEQYPHIESRENAAIQNRTVNSSSIVKGPRNPKDHEIDGAE